MQKIQLYLDTKGHYWLRLDGRIVFFGSTDNVSNIVKHIPDLVEKGIPKKAKVVSWNSWFTSCFIKNWHPEERARRPQLIGRFTPDGTHLDLNKDGIAA